MLHGFLLTGGAVLSLLIASSGTSGVDTAEPSERTGLPTISLKVPESQDWRYSHRTDGQDRYLQLFRQGASPTYTYLVTANVALMTEDVLAEGLPTEAEFLEHVKALSHLQMPRSRFDPIEESFRLDTRFSDLCVCTESSAQDRGAANIGDEPYLILQAKSYNFIIERGAEQRPVVVHISYTERGKTEEIGPYFDRRAEQFFAAVAVEMVP
jgi:hypothetical protein